MTTGMPNSPTLLRQFRRPKPTINLIIATNLRFEMKQQKLSTAQLARVLGWSYYKALSRVSGGNRMTVTDLAELSAALGVSMVSLVDSSEVA